MCHRAIISKPETLNEWFLDFINKLNCIGQCFFRWKGFIVTHSWTNFMFYMAGRNLMLSLWQIGC
ncbi:hypothetical protein Peur_050559 [Populus x canadensis]